MLLWFRYYLVFRAVKKTKATLLNNDIFKQFAKMLKPLGKKIQESIHVGIMAFTSEDNIDLETPNERYHYFYQKFKRDTGVVLTNSGALDQITWDNIDSISKEDGYVYYNSLIGRFKQKNIREKPALAVYYWLHYISNESEATKDDKKNSDEEKNSTSKSQKDFIIKKGKKHKVIIKSQNFAHFIDKELIHNRPELEQQLKNIIPLIKRNTLIPEPNYKSGHEQNHRASEISGLTPVNNIRDLSQSVADLLEDKRKFYGIVPLLTV